MRQGANRVCRLAAWVSHLRRFVYVYYLRGPFSFVCRVWFGWGPPHRSVLVSRSSGLLQFGFLVAGVRMHGLVAESPGSGILARCHPCVRMLAAGDFKL